jgi:hypothetical protein
MNRALSTFVLLLLLLTSKASPLAADQNVKIPFEYATGQNALLVHVSINNKPALLILDTGSPVTVIQPKTLGLTASELARKQLDSFRPVGTFKGINMKVELRVGDAVWKAWPVKVADQSQTLAAYLDIPDGVLGIDFLQQFSGVVFDLDGKTITLNRSSGQSRRHLSGNLRDLAFSIKNGQYTLNNVALERAARDSVEFSTQNQPYRVRVDFQATVLVSRGKSADIRNQESVEKWAQTVPLVSEILKLRDERGALKPILYTLLSPKNPRNIQIREQLTLLWSADPVEKENVGQTGFGPPMQLSEQIIDVQYRSLANSPTDYAISKIMLQVLYIHDDGPWMTLGALVISSSPNGDYEFYIVPRHLLDQIVIGRKATSNE